MQNMDNLSLPECYQLLEVWKTARLNSSNTHTTTLLTDDACVDDDSASRQQREIQKGGHFMTYMQNLYAQTVENQRSHQAQEELKARELTETERSHRVNEALSEADLREKIRHQTTQDTETMRHNLATEDEIRIHNRNTEEISRRANDVALIGHQLSLQAQRERNISNEDIAHLQNATKLYLESAQLRINETNSKSQAATATAKLMEAKAKIDAAEASLRNAAVNEDLAPSEKFQNIGRGLSSITQAVENTSDIVQDWIPQTKAANAAGGAAKNISRTARSTGRKNAKVKGDSAREILEASGYGND
jgi:hypothetical protein